MKNLILFLLAITTLALASCTTAEKAEARQLLVTAGKQLGRDLIAASAATGAELVDNQIALLNAKLDDQEAALGTPPDPVKLAKIKMLRASLRGGDKLADELQRVLAKVQTIDDIPGSPQPVELPGVTVSGK